MASWKQSVPLFPETNVADQTGFPGFLEKIANGIGVVRLRKVRAVKILIGVFAADSN